MTETEFTAAVEATKVAFTTVWSPNENHRRVYVQFRNAQRSFRGDSTYKLYYDAKQERVIEEGGKGTRSAQMRQDIETVLSAVQ